MKKEILFPFALAISVYSIEQTPSQLRIKTDANGALVVSSAAQVNPVTTTTFNNARLRVDAAGNLVTTLGSTGQQLFADGTSSAPSIAFASEPSSGIYRPAAGYMGFSTSAGTGLFGIRSNAVVALGSGVPLAWSSTATFDGTSDTNLSRNAAGKITLTGTTPMIQLGGSTSSFPAWKRNGTAIEARLADDSGFSDARANDWYVAGAIRNNAGSGAIYYSVAPSAPSSCGTSPAVTTNNGTAAFVVTGGTGGTATGCTITMPTATTGWNCHITNITQTAAHRADRDTRQTASTTTSVTWEYVVVSTGAATAFTASDVFRGVCFGY